MKRWRCCAAKAGRIDCGTAGEWVRGLDEVLRALAPFTAEAVAGTVGLDAGDIRRLAAELAPRLDAERLRTLQAEGALLDDAAVAALALGAAPMEPPSRRVP